MFNGVSVDVLKTRENRFALLLLGLPRGESLSLGNLCLPSLLLIVSFTSTVVHTQLLFTLFCGCGRWEDLVMWK